MSLDREQIIEVLQAAATFDRRTIGETDVLAWSEAARIGRWATRMSPEGDSPSWSNQLALDAVRHHYATTAAYLMPGHITAWIRNERTKPAEAATLLIEKTPATEATRAAVMDQVRKLAEKTRMDRPDMRASE